MKLFAFLLLIAAFLQTAFIPLNLCLLILICRSFAIHSKQNYYLALIAGVYLGILSTTNVGFWPLIFVVAVLVTHILRLIPISGRSLTIIPIAFSILFVVSIVESVVMKTPFLWWYPLISSLLSLPIFIIIREWEDRFISKTGVKLKV